jgi:hypothetical protein
MLSKSQCSQLTAESCYTAVQCSSECRVGLKTEKAKSAFEAHNDRNLKEESKKYVAFM